MKNAVTNKIRLLKDIQPNPDWLKSQRSNLLLEISESGNKAKSAWKLPVFSLPNFAFRPVLVSLTLFCLIFGGGFLTILAAKTSLPGDLLYPIKIAVENTKVKVSSQEARPGLEAEFVGARAEELSQIIEGTEDPIERKEKAVKAVDKLQAQVLSAKVNLDKIKEAQPEKVVEAVEAISEKTVIVKEKLAEEFKEEETEDIAQAIDALDAAVAIITGETEGGIEVHHEVKEMEEALIDVLPTINEASESFEEISE